jgi:hypothetical protein
MLPSDWGDGRLPPRVFRLPADWQDIHDRYRGLGPSDPLDSTFALLEGEGADVALLEREYIDSDYRDEFAHFYSSRFRGVPDRCERLHFAAQGRYLGYVSIRPIKRRPVSRTLVAPPAALQEHVSCTADASAHVFREHMPIRCFPFMGQDAQYGICAHASIWMVAHYHHLVNHTRRVFVSDVVTAARVRAIDRQTPSPGLTLEQVGAALSEIGLPAVRYQVEKLASRDALEQVVCRYLNSRLPLLLVLPGHVTVLVGYGHDSTNGKLFFVRNDDAAGPYVRIDDWTNDPKGKWLYLFVPMPGRIYLVGELAESIARLEFERLIKSRSEFAEVEKGLAADELRFRTYAIRGSEYKLRLQSRGVPVDVMRRHSVFPLSNWVWVTELQDRVAANTSRQCVVGEVVIDATSDHYDPNFLVGSLPGFWLGWRTAVPEWHPVPGAPALYESGAALHA